MKQYFSLLKKYFQLPFDVPKTWVSHLLEITRNFFCAAYIAFYFSAIPGWPQLSIYFFAMGLFLLFFTLTAYTLKKNKEFFESEERIKVYIVHELIGFIACILTFFLCKFTIHILRIINNEYVDLIFIFCFIGLVLYFAWRANGKNLPEQLTVNTANGEKTIDETPDKTE